jgi:hypothetical protein
MLSAIASIALGVLGWLVTSFFAKPLLDFLNLRKAVHEEIIYTGNMGESVAHTPEFETAAKALRRLGAKVQATAVTDSKVLRWFLDYWEYDLIKAGRGLIGLSNDLDKVDGSRALQTNTIQTGLKLPRDYDDEMIEAIKRRRDARA